MPLTKMEKIRVILRQKFSLSVLDTSCLRCPLDIQDIK